MIIAGPGPASLSVARSGAAGTPDFRIFTVAAGIEVSISGLTITGGSGGGIFSSGIFSSGGGIANAGTLTLTDCTLSGNSATGIGNGNGSGGGISNTGTLALTDCTLSGNTAIAGGGIGISRYVGIAR